MTRALLLILILSHLSGPTLAEAPTWTREYYVEYLEKQVEELWPVRRWMIDHGITRTIHGEVIS